MIKYRTKWEKIEAHEVLRETDKMVVLAPKSSANTCGRELKEAKRSEWQNWHDTWEDAHAFIVEKAQREVDSLRMRLEQAKGRLGNIKGMVPNVELSGLRASCEAPLERRVMPPATTEN